WSVAPGSDYCLMVYSGTSSLVRESSLGGFPYALGDVGAITNGYIGGNSSTYYYLYNWVVQTSCKSERVAVTATVSTPPALTLSSEGDSICAGSTVENTLMITEGADGYDTFVWTPSEGVTGDEITGYTFNPTETTTYTLTASNDVCANIASYTVTVNEYPVMGAVSPAEPVVCSAGDAVALFVESPDVALGSGTASNSATGHPA